MIIIYDTLITGYFIFNFFFHSHPQQF